MKYQVYSHTSTTPIAEFDKLTFCVHLVWNHLADSKLSWKDYFRSNPMRIVDTASKKTVWSTKCHE